MTRNFPPSLSAVQDKTLQKYDTLVHSAHRAERESLSEERQRAQQAEARRAVMGGGTWSMLLSDIFRTTGSGVPAASAIGGDVAPAAVAGDASGGRGETAARGEALALLRVTTTLTPNTGGRRQQMATHGLLQAHTKQRADARRTLHLRAEVVEPQEVGDVHRVRHKRHSARCGLRARGRDRAVHVS